jgi:glucosidase
MSSFSLGVEKFPDLLPLRNRAGQAIGLFSDHGSWLGVVWGESCLLEIRDICDGTARPFDLGSPLRLAQSWPDRQDATLLDGTELRLGFTPKGDLLIEVQSESEPEPESALPHKIFPKGQGCWWILLGPEAENGAAEPDPDIFEQNRTRWNELFEIAFAGMDRLGSPTSQVLLARAITTLMWNYRAPRKNLAHAGIIPSPFSYRGYWAGDSWKQAHALAWFAPKLAAEQLRAQLSRQQGDGMVADTVMPDPADDNWNNSKPPMAAWALEAIWDRTQSTELLAELYPKCAAQIRWWQRARRLPGEILFRAGGVSHQTAVWDTGWDPCHRFADIPLITSGSWQLLDLWQPDLNAFLLNEYRALSHMAAAAGDDPEPWENWATELDLAIQRALWNESLGCFCDVRASNGASTGIRSAACWLPLWVGSASAYQRQRTLEDLTSPTHFGTPMPFPTLATSEQEFEPDGFWNGSVWADYAAFAFHVLGDQGTALRVGMRDHLALKQSLFECYSPLDGKPAYGGRPAGPQFSRTAAAGIEVLHGGPYPSRWD